MFIVLIPIFKALNCIDDSDCRISNLPDFSSLYCVNNKCEKIKPPNSQCYLPTECSSFPYYGPLACSETCKSGSECNKIDSEKSTFCCKSIPLKGECNIDRPGSLSGCLPTHVCSLENGKPTCLEKREKSWILGIFLSVLGNIFINLGINFQKKSYKQNYINIDSFLLNTMVFGSIVYSIGKIMGFSSYIFGNQSLLAGLSATGLISNSIFAPLINNEIFTWKDGIAILLVLIGSSTIIYNTSKSHVIYSLCKMMKMYKKRNTILWFIFILFCILILYTIIKFVEINSDWENPNDNIEFLRSTIFFPSDGIVCRYIMVFVYVQLSSFIASFTTLSAKSLGELIDKTLMGDNQFFNLAPYFFLLNLIICTLLQIYWLNRALRHYDALLVVPIFHISWTILSILTAAIHFQDFDHYSLSQLKYFVLGICIIFCGSIFLGLRIVNKNVIKSKKLEIPENQNKKD